MNSNRETNSDLNHSEENEDKNEEIKSPKRYLFRHRLSERKPPSFLKKSRKPSITHKIVSEIEETKNKIMKNLETIKIFDINSKKISSKNIKDYYDNEDNNRFNIYKYLDERKNIKNKLSLYNNKLDSDVLHLIEYLSLEP